VSPDGSRLVYSSYLGRVWHNLWVMPAAGGDAFPISYGDWDETYPRWAPDGTRIAFISNKNGNTEIGIERIPGGVAETLAVRERRYLAPRARLNLDIKDSRGQAGSARVSVTMQRAASTHRRMPGSARTIPSTGASGAQRRTISMRMARSGSTCRRVP